MQKKSSFLCLEQSGQAGVENGAMLTTYSDILQNAPFRSQIFKNFLYLRRQGGIDPLTKVLRTFLAAIRTHWSAWPPKVTETGGAYRFAAIGAMGDTFLAVGCVQYVVQSKYTKI